MKKIVIISLVFLGLASSLAAERVPDNKLSYNQLVNRYGEVKNLSMKRAFYISKLETVGFIGVLNQQKSKVETLLKTVKKSGDTKKIKKAEGALYGLNKMLSSVNFISHMFALQLMFHTSANDTIPEYEHSAIGALACSGQNALKDELDNPDGTMSKIVGGFLGGIKEQCGSLQFFTTDQGFNTLVEQEMGVLQMKIHNSLVRSGIVE